jgi:UDP-N-acetylglucosamine 2-epimerase (non-hydrolysing)
MKIAHVVGARPNFMKMAPVHRALIGRADQLLIHTGQHYDRNMSDVFFEQLGIGDADVNLDVGSGSHAQQTAQVMMRIEPVLLEHRPDALVVYGDVNSTMAATLVAAKLGIKVVHVEAGLRSFDRTMPEELNRLVTDQLADMLLTPSRDADENLKREGVACERIFFVGNVMIDTLVRLLPLADSQLRASALASWLDRDYILVTLHRPSNVDEPEHLRRIVGVLADLAREVPVVFPVHPRTRARIEQIPSELHLVEPLGYLEFLALQSKAKLVITDSGGVQEETTYLGVPCLTARENTERPITVTCGTNILVGRDVERLRSEARAILGGNAKRGSVPELWDGRAAERIAQILLQLSS